jgi:hypothetical protein
MASFRADCAEFTYLMGIFPRLPPPRMYKIAHLVVYA